MFILATIRFQWGTEVRFSDLTSPSLPPFLPSSLLPHFGPQREHCTFYFYLPISSPSLPPSLSPSLPPLSPARRAFEDYVGLLLRDTEEASFPRSLCLDALVLLWSEEENVFGAVEGWVEGRREGGSEGGGGVEEVRVFLDEIGRALGREGGGREGREGGGGEGGGEEAAAFQHAAVPVVVAVGGGMGVEV